MTFNQKEYFNLLGELVSNNAILTNPIGMKKNVDFIKKMLIQFGFEVKTFGDNRVTPIIYAVKKNLQSNGRVGLYSHYDVEITNDELWKTTSTELSIVDDRLFGRGVADNLGIFLLRMFAIKDMKDNDLPEIHWLFQGQEEIASPLAHEVFPTINIPNVNLWFEETGYFDLGTARQRFLTINEDEKLEIAKKHIIEPLKDIDFSTYTENRSLTKFDPCPFLNHILKDNPYLAIGPNDEFSKIHQPNESLAIPLIEKSYNQFILLMKYYTTCN